MMENSNTNSFFQDNTVLNVVSDIAKDLNQYKTQVSNSNFNSISMFESKLENIHNYMQYVENRFSSETNSLYNNVKDQFDFISNQFSNVMSAGSIMDSRVQNIERRVDNLYDQLTKYEININTRLTSLEEIKALYNRIDEKILQMNSKVEQLFYMTGKNEQKLDLIMLQKEASSKLNSLDGNDQFFKDRNRKIDEIYHNLRENLKSEQPTFNFSNKNFDIKPEDFESSQRKFEFNTFSKDFESKTNNFSNLNPSQTTSNQNSTQKNKSDSLNLQNSGFNAQGSTKTTPKKSTTNAQTASVNKNKGAKENRDSKLN